VTGEYVDPSARSKADSAEGPPKVPPARVAECSSAARVVVVANTHRMRLLESLTKRLV